MHQDLQLGSVVGIKELGSLHREALISLFVSLPKSQPAVAYLDLNLWNAGQSRRSKQGQPC